MEFWEGERGIEEEVGVVDPEVGVLGWGVPKF
jgi:hypothetical protein